MEAVWYVFLTNLQFIPLIFILGLLLGSFISAITYRIPRNMGFVKGRSFCDLCKKDLYWYDNIPLLSFLFYKGKSRCCKKTIPARYPLIELASAIGISIIWFLTSNIFFVILFLITLCIFIIDLEHQIIPDELSWIVLGFGVLMHFTTIYSSLFAGLLMAFSILLIFLATLGRGMGLGDVKLALALGVWLGLSMGLPWLLVSFIIGGIVASILLLLKKAKLKTKIAFGPFLIFAFWIVMLI